MNLAVGPQRKAMQGPSDRARHCVPLTRKPTLEELWLFCGLVYRKLDYSSMDTYKNRDAPPISTPKPHTLHCPTFQTPTLNPDS